MPTIRATARHALLLALAALLTLAGTAPATAADAPASRDDVYRSLKVDDVPAAYVVLVDVSSSMQDKGPDGTALYTTVKRRLGDFLASLTPADQVAVVTFGRATSVVRPLSPADRTGDLIDRELPRNAQESASDHGAALDAAADQLDRSKAPVGAVLMLTDGAVNAPGSPYAKLGSPAWKRLHDRYRALGADSKIAGYGLPLAEGTGVSEVLGSAFGTPRILPVDPAALGSQLNAAKDQVRTRKAVSLLRGDRGATVTVGVAGEDVRAAGSGRFTVPAGGTTGTRTRVLEVALESRARYVPLTVRLSGGGDASVSVPGGPLTLRPGERRTVRVTLRWRQDPEFSLFPVSRDFTARVSLRARVGSPWTPTIRGSLAEGKFTTGNPAVTELDVTGSVPGRTPGWLYPLVLLVLLLGAAAWRRRHKQLHPELSGFLVVTDLRSGERQSVPLRGREVVQDTDAGQVRARVTVRGRMEGGRLVLVLTCRREAPRAGGARLSDSGTCEFGKSTVLCGIGISHETTTGASVLR
ncbi:von Willebrand factor type A [Streptomyces zinciresistens K42]|uniref:von Willebrand factor type A n=1 Tax=Streptomyces zinciresistens K42 TaxID=700597 RepID=G2GIK8_9ACTN|nr:vWA domain-containing protein [Streptomyces zinciresistens]EGX56668.1 von Willebrand factor type A [Streptomyces zinciresistens K42]